MTRKPVLALFFILISLYIVHADDYEDNKLEEGEVIYQEPEIGEGQEDNFSDPTEEADNFDETAEWDIAHEHNDMTHVHLTFRSKYLSATRDKRNKVKKPAKHHFDTLISKAESLKGVEKLNPKKKLVAIHKNHKTNIMFECNFAPEFFAPFIREIKNYKEVLLIEFKKQGEKGEHHEVWGIQAEIEEIEQYTHDIMQKEMKPKTKEELKQHAL